MKLSASHKATAAILLLPCLAGCNGIQSSLNPKSPQAESLAHLFWIFTGICSGVWLLVMIALAVAVFRGGRAVPLFGQDSPKHFRRKAIVVASMVAVTVAILSYFTIVSFYTTRDFMRRESSMTIKVTGQQWWWELEYESGDPSQVFTTANEIHIPVGVPVLLDLEAADVIHSFWVPALMGKQDLIPGRKNTMLIQASRAGVYRGQCAQFCGLQHAHMALLIYAQSQHDFDEWRKHQLESATPPRDQISAQGLQRFLNLPCASCHTIEGTSAGGKVGPDLTHFGSRATIAAGTLPNTPANLWLWIANPQAVKPGCNMPQVSLAGPDFAKLDAYLEGLK